MTNYVKTLAQQAVNNTVRKAVGNLMGGSNNSSNDFVKLSTTGSTSTTAPGHGKGDTYKVLAFPIDVLSDPNMGNHGHYIQFFVNVQSKAKIKFHPPASARTNMVNAMGAGGLSQTNSRKLNPNGNYFQSNASNFGSNVIAGLEPSIVTPTFGASSYSGSKLTNRSDIIANKFNNEAARTSTFRTVRAETIRSTMCINMFMPAQVQVKYGAEYTDTNIGALSAQAMDAFNQLMNGNFDGFGKTVVTMTEPAKEMILQLMTSLAGTIGPVLGGLEETRAMKSGTIIGEKLELAFKGVPKRNFSYTFKMIPKSQQEADEVQKIIKAFKSNMLPELENPNARRLTVPNTFNIQYMYVNEVNNYLHKIGECVLESMDVTYGGDRYKTFTAVPGQGAPPVETTMTLNFKEFHFLTRNDVENEGM
jgi:hypothetical protein